VQTFRSAVVQTFSVLSDRVYYAFLVLGASYVVRPKSYVLGAFPAGRGQWTEDHGRTKYQVPSTKYRLLHQNEKRRRSAVVQA